MRSGWDVAREQIESGERVRSVHDGQARGYPAGALVRSDTRCACGRLAPLTDGLCWPCRERRDRRWLAEFWLFSPSGCRLEVEMAAQAEERARRARGGVA